MKNIDLHKYRGKLLDPLVSHEANASRLAHLVLQVLLALLWRPLSTLCSPIGKILSGYLWAGRWGCMLALHVQRLLLGAVGWLAGSPFQRGHIHHGRKPHSLLVVRIFQYYVNVLDVRRWHLLLTAAACTALINSITRRMCNAFDVRAQEKRRLQALMMNATNYEQWQDYAFKFEKLEREALTAKRAEWGRWTGLFLSLGVPYPGKQSQADVTAKVLHSDQDDPLLATRKYDRKLLAEKTAHLKKVSKSGNIKEIMFTLRLDLVRNIANIASSKMYERFPSIPEPIQEYTNEVKELLYLIRDAAPSELPMSEKLSFFREVRHAFGKTALLLSGGGSLGTFHMGICKALFEKHMLPRVLAGSSAGSIVSAMIATRTDPELRDLFSKIDQFEMLFFNNNSTAQLVMHVIKKGSLQDMAFMIKRLRTLLGDLTFLEAYERTGRILNVTVCPADTNEPPRLLNYLTAPHALVWSAVAASSAFPGLYPAQHLLARNIATGEIVTFSAQGGDSGLQRRWQDGSLEMDLPSQALGEMFNCNHYLVSQTNPHIVPLLNLKRGLSTKWSKILEAELKHRCQILQWLLPDWIPSRWLSLFTQPWEGDVTMTLPIDLWDLNKAITNPTAIELQRLIKVGEVAAWEKLSAIECNCAIEATLDSCLAKVTNQVRGRPVASMQTRLPSWLHMPALGMPTVASWGEGLEGVKDMAQAGSWGEMDKAAVAPDGLPVVPIYHHSSSGTLKQYDPPHNNVTSPRPARPSMTTPGTAPSISPGIAPSLHAPCTVNGSSTTRLPTIASIGSIPSSNGGGAGGRKMSLESNADALLRGGLHSPSVHDTATTTTTAASSRNLSEVDHMEYMDIPLRTGALPQQSHSATNKRYDLQHEGAVNKPKDKSSVVKAKGGAENHLNLADLDGSWYVPRDNGGTLREEDLIALASMDCRNDMQAAGSGGFWGALLPLAGQSEGRHGIQEAVV
ncbi:hypothetical protein CEUSTIGMA_g5481.t1 [Chlamydomonas eustigma]|uniref:PNPLA domain-containing protein n=1 Tax=Chlamydomonas eustigma TaxID=1157962 RepID=A0A250X546_9CHLO|nr:hypothetical protein CEUSTIGMA_g5481.t1 [Chlamydomonas eustigma]|eukprot:GAX78039.1 hypothetical protein CEUSTIGMA_g5481.t1 [Chlamydomonas eustigma]